VYCKYGGDWDLDPIPSCYTCQQNSECEAKTQLEINVGARVLLLHRGTNTKNTGIINYGSILHLQSFYDISGVYIEKVKRILGELKH
jgi:hypothetical protein